MGEGVASNGIGQNNIQVFSLLIFLFVSGLQVESSIITRRPLFALYLTTRQDNKLPSKMSSAASSLINQVIFVFINFGLSMYSFACHAYK